MGKHNYEYKNFQPNINEIGTNKKYPKKCYDCNQSLKSVNYTPKK